MKNSKSEKSGGEISTGEKRQLDSERDFSREKHEMEMKLLEEQRAKEKSKLKPIVLKKQDLKDERQLRDHIFKLKEVNPEKYEKERSTALKDRPAVKYDLIDFIHQRLEEQDQLEKQRKKELRKKQAENWVPTFPVRMTQNEKLMLQYQLDDQKFDEQLRVQKEDRKLLLSENEKMELKDEYMAALEKIPKVKIFKNLQINLQFSNIRVCDPTSTLTTGL